MNKKITLGLLLLTVIALVGVPGASALPSYKGDHPHPVTATQAANCKACHVSSGAPLDLQTCTRCHPDPYPSAASTATPTTTPTATPMPNATFAANLTGSEEVPPVVTLARGNATFNLSDNGTVLKFNVTVANITNATLSHIHLAPPGANGSIVVNLFTGPTKTGSFNGVLAEGNITQANLTGPLAGQPLSALINNMTANNTYVNVHTTQHPDGEIRGQIYAAPSSNVTASNATPSNVTPSATP